MSKRAYISLGSNLGLREQHLNDAQAQLAASGTVFAASSLYETEPVEFTEQPWFVNCVVGLETGMSPRELLNALLAIEHTMGRQRTQLKGPRKIDLDILLFAGEVIHEPGLVIPHPALAQRRFVLEPLAEIAPDVVHPVLGKSMRQLKAELPDGQIVRKMDAKR
jgi:2-amino-4-hydroxy-6-hydroxymethyldihydropteridine diphosphokinase